MYGVAGSWVWRLLDTNAADLAILPAEIPFAIRCRLPPTSFRAATEPFAYVREYRGAMRFTANSLPLDDPKMKTISRGFAFEPGAMRLDKARGRIVFAAEWPFATAFELVAKSAGAQRLRAGIGHAFGRVAWLTEVALALGAAQAVHAPIPPGEFDSGINEVVLEHDRGEPVTLTAFRIEDGATYRHAMDVVPRRP
jgi:hypothetical protein